MSENLPKSIDMQTVRADFTAARHLTSAMVPDDPDHNLLMSLMPDARLALTTEKTHERADTILSVAMNGAQDR